MAKKLTKKELHRMARNAHTANREIRYTTFQSPGTSPERNRNTDIRLRDRASQSVGRYSGWDRIVAHSAEKF